MEVAIKTDQIKVLQDFFDGLSHIDQKKIFMASFRKAAKPLVIAARASAPYRRGVLVKSIGTIEKPDDVSILVGAKLSGTNKGWYGNFSEEGTKERFRRKKKNAPTGRVRAVHWFERAYNLTQEKMYNDMAQEWYNEIDRYIQRVNKRLK